MQTSSVFLPLRYQAGGVDLATPSVVWVELRFVSISNASNQVKETWLFQNYSANLTQVVNVTESLLGKAGNALMRESQLITVAPNSIATFSFVFPVKMNYPVTGTIFFFVTETVARLR